MNFFKKHKALVIGASLIVLTNAVALGGVAYNRGGAPDSNLQLSQRELGYSNYDSDDNSGIAVSLSWKVLSKDIVGTPSRNNSYDWYNYSREAYWLTGAKMTDLGFDIKAPDFREDGTYRYRQLKDREVFLVLELAGPAYELYASQAKVHAKVNASKEEALRQVKEAEEESSRLFVVDAGLDAKALRQRYPNRNMYAIAKGIVGAHWQSTGGKPELNAYVDSLSVSSLHVPKPYDAIFGGYDIGNALTSKYQVNVIYGRRYEPWIAGARRGR